MDTDEERHEVVNPGSNCAKFGLIFKHLGAGQSSRTRLISEVYFVYLRDTGQRGHLYLQVSIGMCNFQPG